VTDFNVNELDLICAKYVPNKSMEEKVLMIWYCNLHIRPSYVQTPANRIIV